MNVEYESCCRFWQDNPRINIGKADEYEIFSHKNNQYYEKAWAVLPSDTLYQGQTVYNAKIESATSGIVAASTY